MCVFCSVATQSPNRVPHSRPQDALRSVLLVKMEVGVSNLENLS